MLVTKCLASENDINVSTNKILVSKYKGVISIFRNTLDFHNINSAQIFHTGSIVFIVF